MKSLKVRGFAVVTVYSTPYGDEGRSYQVELWEQPLHLWLLATIYHWYDMWIFKVPGFKALERWQLRRHNPLSYLPWSARQDVRCYYLTEKKRKVLAALNIDDETYRKIK